MRLDDYRVMKRPDKKLESAWGGTVRISVCGRA